MKLLKIWILTFVGLCALLCGSSVMALSTIAFPTLCKDATGIGTRTWIKVPNSGFISDYTVSVDGTTSHYEQCSGYAFNIPVSATINGIVVNVTRKSDGTANGGSRDAAMRLIKGGVVGTTDRSSGTVFGTTAVSEAHGSSSDLWGDTWTAAEINAANFGAAFAVRKASSAGLPQTVSVDSMTITVYYTTFSCNPPANTPAGLNLTCQCDTFERPTLQPSTIFNSDWQVSANDTTGVVPSIVSPGYLRLTNNSSMANNAKVATVPGIFPAAGNYFSVEFRNYAYNAATGGGGDGIALTLSDSAVPAKAGAYGGSMGYAQRTGADGFAGGWLGIALDEYGNFQDPGEGRVGGPGKLYETASMRGSGAGANGYPWLVGSVDPTNRYIDNGASKVPSYGDYYQVIVDARANNGAGGAVITSLNRDMTGGGTAYTPLIAPFDVFSANPSQASVPLNWQLSFTGSTGGAANIHEIGALRICSQISFPPGGGATGGFNAIDESYTATTSNALQGHLYTKLAGTDFRLDIAALNASLNDINTSYGSSGGQTVTVQLIDDSAGFSCNASVTACKACTKQVVAAQTMAFTPVYKGYKTSGVFNLPSAYKRIIAKMSDGSTTACSTDAFAVRPLSFSSVTSTATNTSLAGAPKFKAGTDTFSLTATTPVANYTGTPKVNTAAMAANSAGWTVGELTPATLAAAVASVPAGASISTGSYTYSEVGHFKFLGYATTNTTAARGIYDDTWTAVDQGTQGDCVVGSYSNALNLSGKYGCLFGIVADTALFGRFVPDHFALVSGSVTPYSNGFTYMGQAALAIDYQLEARNGGKTSVTNYSALLAGMAAYPVAAPALVAEDQGALHQGCDLVSRILGLPNASWISGVYTVSSTTAAATFSRPKVPVLLDQANCAGTIANAGAGASGPFNGIDIGVAMKDADAGAVMTEPLTTPVLNMDSTTKGDCTLTSSCTARRIGSTRMLYGRMKLSNAFGSELLPLQVPMEVQFWNGPNAGFVRNAADSATSVAVPGYITLAGVGSVPAGNANIYFYPVIAGGQNRLSAGNTIATLANPTLANGTDQLNFTAPGIGFSGWVDVVLATPAHLLGSWGNCSGQGGIAGLFDDLPCARATFGLFQSPLIYRRENY